MAAITPFKERQNDPAETPEQRTVLSSAPEAVADAEAQAAAVAHGQAAPTKASTVLAESLNQSHAEILQTTWIRQEVLEALMGARFQVQVRNQQGANPREVFIVLDRTIPVRELLPWSPSDKDISQASLLGWTSKMGCPSFSLPAGPLETGGSCPGAKGGMSVIPPKMLLNGQREVERVLKRPARLADAICQHCYAEGGQYSTVAVQVAQILRYVWARQALENGTFVETMVYAIDQADFHLGPSVVKKTQYRKERHPGRYFRWHDSGDIFSREYLAGMKAVADALPDVTFWAPTRCWATSWGVDAVNAINAPMRNLIIRPSAYHTNERAPKIVGEGWAGGSVVFSEAQKPFGMYAGDYDWDCQAYAVDSEGASCRNAVAPDGGPGCRACWRYPQATINYTLH